MLKKLLSIYFVKFRAHWAEKKSLQQVVQASNLTLLAAEHTDTQGNATMASDDLPNACLLSRGFCCIAQEGGISIAIETPRGQEAYPVFFDSI